MSNSTVIVSENLQRIAKELTQELEDLTGEKIGLSLFVWTEDHAQYVSNTKDRPAIKAAINQILDGWDAGHPNIPYHKKS